MQNDTAPFSVVSQLKVWTAEVMKLCCHYFMCNSESEIMSPVSKNLQ